MRSPGNRRVRRAFYSSALLIGGMRPAAASSQEAPETFVAVSSGAFQTVCEALRAVAFVETDFAEEKTLHILSHPLHSKGTLMFAPQKGVYRVMQEPLHQELLITRDRLVQKDSEGKVERMSVRGQPAAQAFVNVFLSFFSGDQGAWRKAFTLGFSGTSDAWRIAFSPRHGPVAKAIQGIVLEGHEGVLDAMTLTEANGDITKTTYTNQRVSPASSAVNAVERFPADLKSE